MKEINLGNFEQMEHWSKTSAVEPQPVGRHRKRKKEVESGLRFNGDYSCWKKFQKNVKVYPVLRGPHGVFLRQIDAERNRTSNAGHGEQSSIKVDNIQSPKVISTLQDGVVVEDRKGKRCLNPSQFPEQDGANASSRMEDSDVPRSNGGKNENRHVLKREKFPEASTSGQRTEHTDKSVLARKRVNSVLSDFRAYCDDLLEQHKKIKRVDFEAAKLVKKKYGYPNKPVLGSVPGVEIGDRFNYRMELHVLGLHRPIQWGIDSMENGGRKIAISIVDSGGHDNYRRSQDTLVYCGEGGKSRRNGGQECSTEDQKLIKGNLALMNSIQTKNPVRVIRGSRVLNTLSFCYDGLYTVNKMWKQKNLGGNSIFKFELVRIPGQPSSFPRRKC